MERMRPAKDTLDLAPMFEQTAALPNLGSFQSSLDLSLLWMVGETQTDEEETEPNFDDEPDEPFAMNLTPAIQIQKKTSRFLNRSFFLSGRDERLLCASLELHRRSFASLTGVLSSAFRW